MKSLQFHGCKQIAEPRKYCLVCVIVFLWRVLSLFFFFLFLTGWEFRVNSLQHLSSFGIELQWQRQQIFSKIKLRVRLDTVYFTEN